MAVSRATGYTNLPNDNFIPEIYSQKVQKFFRTASVVEDITNTDYAGEIENFGDTVRIIKEPVVTVASYTRGSTINTQELADDQITLVVDQANAFAFKVDDIEERHSHINFESVASSSGAYALKMHMIRISLLRCFRCRNRGWIRWIGQDVEEGELPWNT